MDIRHLRIAGAAELRTVVHGDARGNFAEWYRDDELEDAGLTFSLRQANISTSERGVIRGIHFSEVPPGQAKYVAAVTGRVLDFVVDLRTGSPTYLETEVVELVAADRNAIFLEEGLGHAFLALEDSTVCYMVSSTYDPGREHTLSLFDPALNIDVPFPRDRLIMSDRDRHAPSLKDLEGEGVLPAWSTTPSGVRS